MIALGLLIIAIGAFCQSSSYVPINKIKDWSWESYWIVQGVFAWLLLPFLGALLAVPAGHSLCELFGSNLSASSMTFFYGVLWGVGGLTFGLSMRYLVVALGQSLALGEEAERITDFNSLANYADGRIVTENLDHDYGYFESNDMKRFAKKMVGYQKRSFELSIYTMAQRLVDHIGKDTIICIFPGGQGATSLSNLSKGTLPYQQFMEDIKTAYQQTTEKGWDRRLSRHRFPKTSVTDMGRHEH